MASPYQPRLLEYPKFGQEKHPRRFQSFQFDSFHFWLEYSPIKVASFCLPCCACNTPFVQSNRTTYTIDGFNCWRKVKDGKMVAFLSHVGKVPNSTQKKAEKSCEDLMRQSQHLPPVFNRYSSQESKNNILRLKITIEVIRYLAFQSYSFKGHDKSKKSSNHGNFIQLLRTFTSNNEKIEEVILNNAPKYAYYTSPDIQKEILHVFSMNMKRKFVKK